jgi:hypothetical protein
MGSLNRRVEAGFFLDFCGDRQDERGFLGISFQPLTAAIEWPVSSSSSVVSPE